jgi:hypothetical protein
MTRPRNPATNDKRSADRLANLRRLAAEFQLRAMRITDICAFLGVKKSTARGYVNDLGGALDVTRAKLFEDGYVYRLIADADVDACLASLGNVRKPKESKSQIAVAERAGRQFHITQDDEPYPVKVSRVRIPQHFPLLAAFFGLAQEQRV